MGADLFYRACIERTRGNGLKMRQERCRLDITWSKFTASVAVHWNRLARKVMESLTLDMFRRHLDLPLVDVV